MKKLLLFLLILSPLSVFAGEDTDRICAYETKWGLLYENIKVSYPGENIKVDSSIWKIAIPNPKSGISEGTTKLYYVVNIRQKNGEINDRSELYSYDCSSRTPKKLLDIHIDSSTVDYYKIDFANTHNIILTGRSSGIDAGPIVTVIGFNMRTNKKLFQYKYSKLFDSGEIKGFTSGVTAWYIYFSPSWAEYDDELYRLDKKSLKMTKL